MKPPVPKIKRIHIEPLPVGGVVTHHAAAGLIPPKRFNFATHDKLLSHLAHTMKSVWLGNKTGTPHLKGAIQAKREKELETSGYAAPKL